jgi:hypothetical protein
LDLLAKHEHLSLELGLVAPAAGDRVEDDANQQVKRSGSHGDRS